MSVYAKYIQRGLMAFVFSTLIVVVAFYLVQKALQTPDSVSVTEDVVVSESASSPDPDITLESKPVVKMNDEAIVQYSGFYVRDIPMSDEQRSLLKNVGIDGDFYIDAVMQECAADKLGTDRQAAIFAGGVPTVIETTKLLTCLR